MGGGWHDRPMPHYRPAPEYPPLPDCPPATGAARLPGHRPMPTGRPADCTLPDEFAALDYLLAPGCPPVADQSLVAGWPPAPDYPAVPHYLSVRDCPPAPARPAGPARGYRRTAGLEPHCPAADGRAGRLAAVLGYLTVPVFGAPVVIYLATPRGSRWARRHAAQAVSVWFTGLLYDLSTVIMGTMLALGSPPAALAVFAPLVAGRWLVTLAYLARAARAAGRGGAAAFPAWLCLRLPAKGQH